MDILRKELNEIYRSQRLDKECLDQVELVRAIDQASNFVITSKGCSVVTDAADESYMIPIL